MVKNSKSHPHHSLIYFSNPQKTLYFTHLKVRTGDASSYLLEEGLHDLLELGRLYDVQNLLDLSQKHHLLLAAHPGPHL